LPQTSVDIQGTATRSRVSSIIPLEQGTLVAVTAFPLVAGTNPADNWVEIGIGSDIDSIQNRVAILDAGYLGTAAAVGWTGSIQGEPALYVYAALYSSASTLVRLSVLVEPT